jgi:hypothetical protein
MSLYDLNEKWKRLLAQGYVEVAPGILRKQDPTREARRA